MIVKKTFTILAFLIIFIACKSEKVKKDFTLEGFVFGTSYKITYLNADKNYQESIDSMFLAFNNSLSTYIPTSDISRINTGDSTIIIDDFFSEVFKKSKKIYKETDGYFDPTVGNLVNAYGFGPNNEQRNLIDEEVKAEMQFVGFDKISLVNGRIIKENSKIYLDFNSIAKGFGIDIIARFFEDKKIENYLIEIGGEIRAKGLKAEQKPWLIKVVNPIDSDNNSGYTNINLSNKSMATSGNYRKFRITDDGKKYVHTINPKTGLALESNLLSASVIAALDCADVDAYATAFMAMGLEKTKLFLETHYFLKVILIYLDDKGNLQEYRTDNQN
ncbi:MAG: FAD:protein FMN transferase [Polaribacter sp.]|uniref:FAD:protein FMN transferase n=1 Tax=Polaribacter sp. TaxID=1920175 RepID=UPI003BB027F1